MTDNGCIGLGADLTRQLNGRAAAMARKLDLEGAADARNSRETAEVTLSRAMMSKLRISHAFVNFYSFVLCLFCQNKFRADIKYSKMKNH